MGNEGQKICGDLPETTAFKSYAAKQERRSQYANYSDLPAVSFLRLTHSEASEGYPTIVNNIQPCPKLCLPMPLAYVGARTDSTSYTATREAWPISAHAHWRSRQDMLYLRRGFSTLVLLVGFVCVCVCVSACLLSHISPTERLFVLKMLSRTQRATKVKKFVGIFLKRLRSRVMPQNMSEKANMLIIPTYPMSAFSA